MIFKSNNINFAENSILFSENPINLESNNIYNECSICMDNNFIKKYYNCNHMLCNLCNEKLKKCPYCKAEIKNLSNFEKVKNSLLNIINNELEWEFNNCYKSKTELIYNFIFTLKDNIINKKQVLNKFNEIFNFDGIKNKIIDNELQYLVTDYKLEYILFGIKIL